MKLEFRHIRRFINAVIDIHIKCIERLLLLVDVNDKGGYIDAKDTAVVFILVHNGARSKIVNGRHGGGCNVGYFVNVFH